MAKSHLYAKPSARCRLSHRDFWDKLDAVAGKPTSSQPQVEAAAP
jgi:hypothetical protein